MRALRPLVGLASLAVLAALLAVAAFRPSRRPEAPAQADERQRHGETTVSAAEVQLGRGIGLNKRILEPTDVFSSQDTIFVSVVTVGQAAHVELSARWIRHGQVLAETTQTITPRGTTVSEFNVWKPRGWDPGAYQVEIRADGVPLAVRTFTMR